MQQRVRLKRSMLCERATVVSTAVSPLGYVTPEQLNSLSGIRGLLVELHALSLQTGLTQYQHLTLDLPSPLPSRELAARAGARVFVPICFTADTVHAFLTGAAAISSPSILRVCSSAHVPLLFILCAPSFRYACASLRLVVHHSTKLNQRKTIGFLDIAMSLVSSLEPPGCLLSSVSKSAVVKLVVIVHSLVPETHGQQFENQLRRFCLRAVLPLLSKPFAIDRRHRQGPIAAFELPVTVEQLAAWRSTPLVLELHTEPASLLPLGIAKLPLCHLLEIYSPELVLAGSVALHELASDVINLVTGERVCRTVATIGLFDTSFSVKKPTTLPDNLTIEICNFKSVHQAALSRFKLEIRVMDSTAEFNLPLGLTGCLPKEHFGVCAKRLAARGNLRCLETAQLVAKLDLDLSPMARRPSGIQGWWFAMQSVEIPHRDIAFVQLNVSMEPSPPSMPLVIATPVAITFQLQGTLGSLLCDLDAETMSFVVDTKLAFSDARRRPTELQWRRGSTVQWSKSYKLDQNMLQGLADGILLIRVRATGSEGSTALDTSDIAHRMHLVLDGSCISVDYNLPVLANGTQVLAHPSRSGVSPEILGAGAIRLKVSMKVFLTRQQSILQPADKASDKSQAVGIAVRGLDVYNYHRDEQKQLRLRFSIAKQHAQEEKEEGKGNVSCHVEKDLVCSFSAVLKCRAITLQTFLTVGLFRCGVLVAHGAVGVGVILQKQQRSARLACDLTSLDDGDAVGVVKLSIWIADANVALPGLQLVPAEGCDKNYRTRLEEPMGTELHIPECNRPRKSDETSPDIESVAATGLDAASSYERPQWDQYSIPSNGESFSDDSSIGAPGIAPVGSRLSVATLRERAAHLELEIEAALAKYSVE